MEGHDVAKELRVLCKLCARDQGDYGIITCLTGQCPTKGAMEEGVYWGNAWRRPCKKATDWLDGYKKKHSLSQEPSTEERMDFLTGQYPHAFDLIDKHDDMASQGAKSIQRDRPHQPYGCARESELFASYMQQLALARLSK